ncbi:hypothetical protein [Sorangium sp. So ce341]
MIHVQTAQLADAADLAPLLRKGGARGVRKAIAGNHAKADKYRMQIE